MSIFLLSCAVIFIFVSSVIALAYDDWLECFKTKDEVKYNQKMRKIAFYILIVLVPFCLILASFLYFVVGI